VQLAPCTYHACISTDRPKLCVEVWHQGTSNPKVIRAKEWWLCLQEVGAELPPLLPRDVGKCQGLLGACLEGQQHSDDPRAAGDVHMLYQVLVLPGLGIHQPAFFHPLDAFSLQRDRGRAPMSLQTHQANVVV
jgi:hypothetical protein